MLPVLPGFGGQVPEGFAALHPGSKFTRQIWQNFNSNYSGVYLLDPTDRLFVDIGKLFIQEQTKVRPPSSDPPPPITGTLDDSAAIPRKIDIEGRLI